MLLLCSGVKKTLGSINVVNVKLSVPHIYRVNPECSVREHYNIIRLFCFLLSFFSFFSLRLVNWPHRRYITDSDCCLYWNMLGDILLWRVGGDGQTDRKTERERELELENFILAGL